MKERNEWELDGRGKEANARQLNIPRFYGLHLSSHKPSTHLLICRCKGADILTHPSIPLFMNTPIPPIIRPNPCTCFIPPTIHPNILGFFFFFFFFFSSISMDEEFLRNQSGMVDVLSFINIFHMLRIVLGSL